MSDLPRRPGEDDEPLDPIDDLEPEPDEPEPEPGPIEPEPEPLEPAEPEPRRRRPGDVTRLRQRNDELARQVQELSEWRRSVEQQQYRPSQPDPAAAQRAEQEFWQALEMMPEIERLRAVEQRNRAQVGQTLQTMFGAMQDRMDKQAFDAAAGTSRLHQHYADEVERLVQSERARGNYMVSRTDVLDQLIGRDARMRQARVLPGQQRRAAARVAGQTVAPPGGQGDVPRGNRQSRDQDANDEALLRGVRVQDL